MTMNQGLVSVCACGRCMLGADYAVTNRRFSGPEVRYTSARRSGKQFDSAGAALVGDFFGSLSIVWLTWCKSRGSKIVFLPSAKP